jgi:hypothetical protein
MKRPEIKRAYGALLCDHSGCATPEAAVAFHEVGAAALIPYREQPIVSF